MSRILSAVVLIVMCHPALAQDHFFDAHPPGYIPRTVPSTAQLVLPRDGGSGRRDRFEIYVAPNIIPEAQAVAHAARVAAAHCRTMRGSGRATIDGIYRYTELRLGSWGFKGRCR